MKYEFFKKNLRKSDYVKTQDIKLFTLWERGKISLDTCYDDFLLNNKIVSDESMEHKCEFEKWLNSIGYFRERK